MTALNPPLRLLHVMTSIDPAAGGVSDSVRSLILHRPPDVECVVVTLDDPTSPFLAELPFPVHALGPVTSVFAYTPALPAWLRANISRFDGVLVHGLWQFHGLSVLRAIPAGVPYVVFTHGMLDPYFKRRFPRKHVKKWVYWLAAEYWVLRKARRVLFTSDVEAQLATQSFWLHRWHPLTVSLGTTPPPAETPQQRRLYLEACPGVATRRFLLFLGRIHPKKGCDLLLEAFAKVAASDPGLDLVMAGPDQTGWIPHLQTIAVAHNIADRIHWPGMLTGDAKWGAFRGCEAFILPSHQENFGIAIAEALACGKPVLISDKVNIAADIAADGCGFVAPDTLQGTLDLLQRWIATPPADRDTMGRSGIHTFHNRYDMTTVSSAVADIFRPSQSQPDPAQPTP